MKKNFTLFLVFLLTCSATQAQQYIDAKRAYGAFMIDAFNNKHKLREAKDLIDLAMRLPENQAVCDAWITKGEIYNEIATQVMTIRSTGLGSQEDLPPTDAPALEAYQAYTKALQLACRKYETKTILIDLKAAQGNLYNFGLIAYQEQKFQVAYEHFNSLLAAHEELKRQGAQSFFKQEADRHQAVYLAAASAQLAGNQEVAKSLFEQLYQANYDNPAIYESLYLLHAPNDIQAAYAYLEEGRLRYPDEASLLFADINHHLRTGQLDQLIGKLNAAIEREPDNISLYVTLGTVYDNLYQQMVVAGNSDEADEYFNAALQHYQNAVSKNPNQTDALYGLGALYYNKAAFTTQKMNALEQDNSAAGLQRLEALQTETIGLFEAALPYFKQVEALNPNDVNTLAALKEIHYKKEDFAVSQEFSRRLGVVQGGGLNARSYYPRS